MMWRRWSRRKRTDAAANLDEVLARAARLGITPDRVLEEYRRIAFANLSHIVHWSDGGMKFKADSELSDDDIAAISEIVESAKEGRPYRVKLYDKKAALDAIARYLGMLPLGAASVSEDEATPDDGKNARQRLIDELDRLAAEAAARSGTAQSEQ
jgi:terminase small subunit-like protein